MIQMQHCSECGGSILLLCYQVIIEIIESGIDEGVIYHRDKIDDMLMLEEMPYTNINFLSNFGDILVCNPNEAHKTGIHMDLKNKFKVALFKIRI